MKVALTPAISFLDLKKYLIALITSFPTTSHRALKKDNVNPSGPRDFPSFPFQTTPLISSSSTSAMSIVLWSSIRVFIGCQFWAA